MKTKIIVALLILVGLVAVVILLKQGNGALVLPVSQTTDTTTEDMSAIKTFMAEPNLELSFVNTDLPIQYFRVGKVTKMGNGENMEAVDGWTRQVNVYDQKALVNGQCSVYEYHTDARNHTLTAVIIRGLRPSEIDNLKNDGVTCVSNPANLPKITKAEAETIAMDYLKRAVPNFNQIKDQFVYTQQQNGESHDWVWEDKGYKLPEGLSSRPYSYPTIRIAVYGNNEIQYWNTVSLFEN
jgi:hypothetical protein